MSVKILEQLKNSPCFEMAYDGKTKECKKCDVARECASKSANNPTFLEMNFLNPETEKALKEASERRNRPNNTVKENDRVEEMPDPKTLSNPELEALLEERGVEVKYYDDPKIHRMRLVMALIEAY